MVGWDWLGAPPGALESCGIEAKKMELSDARRERWPEGQGRAIKLGPSASPCFRACAATLDEASRFGYINSNAMYFILAREPKQSIQPLFV